MTDSEGPREASMGCAEFAAYVGPYFEGVFKKYAFNFVECFCQHDGRECVVMYQSPQQRLLLELSDGAFHVLLGSAAAVFPGGESVDPEGRTGWYTLFLLVEWKSGQRVYTERLVQQIWRGEADPYQVEANLLAEWADRILPLFEPGREAQWREEFQRHSEQKTRRRARWRLLDRLS